MIYLKVKWKHSFSDEPVLLYSELDRERWEVRKVEIFRSGRMGYAGPGSADGGTDLGVEPLPSFEEIAGDPDFEPEIISKAEFDKVWAKATG
ncbi:DUF6881 domain-containing protein [Bradyrhizobium sp. BR 1433]|uniref:DUF6881 domain-containing protein n=1 Tax=Bradyrhizobium sp. BR 1433 TaxID=3447967 RepID=UPI003EE7A133